MQILKTRTQWILSILLMLSAVSTSAAENRFLGYLGLHVADYDLGSNEDENDTGLINVGLGYAINHYIELGLGYQDFGAIAHSSESGSLDVESEAFQVSLTALMPLSDHVRVYAEAGADFWNGEASVNGVSGFGSESGSDDGVDVFYGMGAELALQDGIAATLEYQFHELDQLEVETFAIAVKYYFDRGL